jgi:hypothetical protein
MEDLLSHIQLSGNIIGGVWSKEDWALSFFSLLGLPEAEVVQPVISHRRQLGYFRMFLDPGFPTRRVKAFRFVLVMLKVYPQFLGRD